jgi:hypothetical protein
MKPIEPFDEGDGGPGHIGMVNLNAVPKTLKFVRVFPHDLPC